METPDIQFGKRGPAPRGRQAAFVWIEDQSVDLWYHVPQGDCPGPEQVQAAWAQWKEDQIDDASCTDDERFSAALRRVRKDDLDIILYFMEERCQEIAAASDPRLAAESRYGEFGLDDGEMGISWFNHYHGCDREDVGSTGVTVEEFYVGPDLALEDLKLAAAKAEETSAKDALTRQLDDHHEAMLTASRALTDKQWDLAFPYTTRPVG